jgi:hypothetical protein
MLNKLRQLQKRIFKNRFSINRFIGKGKMENTPDDKKEFGKNLLRAWFDTIIIPCSVGLTDEIEKIRSKKYQWDYLRKKFDNVNSVLWYIDRKYFPNLNQFLTTIKRFETLIVEQNESYSRLIDDCIRYEKSILESQLFNAKFDEHFINPKNESIEIIKIYMGGYDVLNLKGMACQYIINQTEMLSSQYTLSPYWNKFSKEFLLLSNTPAINGHYSFFAATLQNHLSIDEKLKIELNEFANEMSIKFDVPLVEADKDKDRGDLFRMT